MNTLALFKMNAEKKRSIAIESNVLIFLLLIVAGLAVYGQIGQHDFINFDDRLYVAENRHVRSGLTRESLAWAFNFADKSGNYWQPLTWLSHMLDVELYGMDAGRHHLSNVFFHIASAILLFAALSRMTGARWRSAFVAGLFALHPLNVESVAWVAERKNVLSTFFWMLTLLTYAFYHERPGRIRYAAVLLVFTLGLLAKPMLVTLPFALLLLDYWPLKRIEFKVPLRNCFASAGRLILEKIPMLVLSGLAVYLASTSLRGLGTYVPLQAVSMSLRVENAIVSYIQYVGKMIWPLHLSVFYPYPAAIPVWQVAGASIFIVCMSILAIWLHKRHAYIVTGWFWFIGTLIPVSGLVQAGLWPALADRWAYVPVIGLFVMISWGAAEIISRWRPARGLVVISVATVLVALMVVSKIQVGYWANSITLFEQAVRATDGSWVGHSNLGKALTDSGRSAEAFEHYVAAVRFNPNSAHAHINLGSALLGQGKIDEAIDQFTLALKLAPDFAEPYNNLGLAHVRRGQINDAVSFFRIALQKNPRHANANQNLKLATSIQEKINRAAGRMHRALKIDLAESDLDLKMVELSKRKRDLGDTVNQFQKALSRQPGFVQFEADNIAAVSKVMQEYEDLLPLFLKIDEIHPGSAYTSYHIACIFSRKGMAEESIEWLSKALSQDPARRDFFLADPDLADIKP